MTSRRRYAPRFHELRMALEDGVPGAIVSGTVGRQSSFEVRVNNKVMFSKLNTYGFPYEQEIVDAVLKIREGEDVEQLTNSSSPCVLL
ncbi:PREDICTED: migration and invasion enhancer 1-like [Priapulus caudatus]|uniref:Migration and invasion enhancer 1-like n=1 Tax=Priapulus caudatus TaxID=37621 RepID=A0ABM1EXV5_PRICU|nr:PREDICTED: migration and invasion enhancer 1-like [Priapulus caudatus]